MYLTLIKISQRKCMSCKSVKCRYCRTRNMYWHIGKWVMHCLDYKPAKFAEVIELSVIFCRQDMTDWFFSCTPFFVGICLVCLYTNIASFFQEINIPMSDDRAEKMFWHMEQTVNNRAGLVVELHALVCSFYVNCSWEQEIRIPFVWINLALIQRHASSWLV